MAAKEEFKLLARKDYCEVSQGPRKPLVPPHGSPLLMLLCRAPKLMSCLDEASRRRVDGCVKSSIHTAQHTVLLEKHIHNNVAETTPDLGK